MLRTLALANGAVVAMSAPSWDEWKQAHGKEYNGPEDERREAIYNTNVEMIESTNAEDLSFTLTVNQFADLSPDEFRALYLTRRNADETLSGLPSLGVHEWHGEMLVGDTDWSAKGAVTGVKNQGQCGGCWAFAATGALEGAQFVAGGGLKSLSEQQFLDCDKTNSGCGGGLEYDGWSFFKKENEAICTEDSYPYTAIDRSCASSGCDVGLPAGAIAGITHVDKSSSSLRSALDGQPVAVGVEASNAWQFYSSGVLTKTCGTNLDHSVLAVGYTSSYWKIKNSWGTSWGESGYIRLTSEGNQCGVLDDASYPTVTASSLEV